MTQKRKTLNEWMTQSEYSRRTGIATTTIRDAITSGRLETNGMTGHACRVRGRMAPAKRDLARKRKIATAQQKNDLDLEKTRVDVELKLQRLDSIRRDQRRSYMSEICDAFMQAFAPLKGKLIELRMSEEQLATLQANLESCMADFDSRVQEAINKGEDDAD